jgi:putative PIN family toxin of toxin-antitoxin system
VLSEHILAEFERTLAKPWFVRELDHDRREGAIAFLRTVSDIVTPDPDVTGIATHPEDDLILATAVAGHADYLVTGDQQLLALGEFQGVRIVTPAAFLALLGAAS